MGALIETRLTVESPEDLADLYYPNGRLGGLSVPGKTPGALGQLVILHVQVERPARQFVVKGQIAWVRHKPGPNQPAGFGLDFQPEDDATRIERRQQVELQVRLVHQGTQRRELMADLSTGGAFVRTWNPLPVGAKVQLFLRPPLALTALELKAQVAWVRLVGDHAGMGLEFDCDEAQRLKLEKLLVKLAR